MGREIFHRFLSAVKALEEGDSHRELMVYGTKGHGKSHLLAALTCYLMFLKRRVIFIPDASEVVQSWVITVRKALLFAWADNPRLIHQIMLLENPTAIIEFIQGNCIDEDGNNVILIIDQMNALQSNEEDNESKRKDAASWLQDCRTEVRTIMSSSANYRSFIKAYKKERPSRSFSCFGGLTEVSFTEYCHT